MPKKVKTKEKSKQKVTDTTKKLNDIVIQEDESDIVLSSGYNGDPDELKEEVKKEAARSDVLSRFLIPLFTFVFITLLVSGLTWYYAKPERVEQTTKEEKIQTPPEVKEEPTETPKTEEPTAETPATEKKEESYTIKEGDTLSSVANAYGLSSSELATYNGITDPNSLQIGQVIKIPIK